MRGTLIYYKEYIPLMNQDTRDQEQLNGLRREIRQVKALLSALLFLVVAGGTGLVLFIRPYAEKLDEFEALVRDIEPNIAEIEELSRTAQEIQPQLKELAEVSAAAREFRSRLDTLDALSSDVSALRRTMDAFTRFIP